MPQLGVFGLPPVVFPLQGKLFFEKFIEESGFSFSGWFTFKRLLNAIFSVMGLAEGSWDGLLNFFSISLS